MLWIIYLINCIEIYCVWYAITTSVTVDDWEFCQICTPRKPLQQSRQNISILHKNLPMAICSLFSLILASGNNLLTFCYRFAFSRVLYKWRKFLFSMYSFPQNTGFYINPCHRYKQVYFVFVFDFLVFLK